MNVPALKGIHYAMMSGIMAAESIFASLKGEKDLAKSTCSPTMTRLYEAALYGKTFTASET